MPTPVSRSLPVEQLEVQRWPDPPEDATSMVKNVHEVLRDTAAAQAAAGWYDDDLLHSVVTRDAGAWSDFPALARELKEIVAGLKELSRYVKTEVEAFLAMPLLDEG
ncbi:hypothetical protein [Streptomyces sp. NBC_00986]|uniref:hypothetical protein n=1 Tax=Streptomyces sp. NBC_00986 TaxID=2903702 RepID=UPI003868EC94|nr:hypothetical protein OG504_21225 [Streptomyces sp. NBC_00986]